MIKKRTHLHQTIQETALGNCQSTRSEHGVSPDLRKNCAQAKLFPTPSAVATTIPTLPKLAPQPRHIFFPQRNNIFAATTKVNGELPGHASKPRWTAGARTHTLQILKCLRTPAATAAHHFVDLIITSRAKWHVSVVLHCSSSFKHCCTFGLRLAA